MGIASMNATIHNNRKLLKNGKRKPFSKMNGASSKIRSYKPYVLPYVQPHKLRRIRLKTKRENRKLLIKKLIVGSIVLGVLLVLFWNVGN
jgi:hypothetical protein